ncbi:MAG: ATP-binding protein [Nitrososphaeria archaeon]
MGARQVGKTTGIKLLIKKLIEENSVKPESIFYFTCDLGVDLEDLKKVIGWYLDYKKANNIASSFIFLDEVTSVREWWKIVKGYIDLGVFKNDVITVSGSSSLKLKGDIELFSGRRGKGSDLIVYPLSFKEFLFIKKISFNLTGVLELDMKTASLYKSEIDRLFKEYLKRGGFPLSINMHPDAERFFLSSFESEVLRANKNIEISKGIVSSILRKAPSPLSYSTIANDLGISYKTVQEYTELFKGLFLLDTALFKENKKIYWKKERKFFFLDPFIANTFSYWTLQNYLESSIYEWIIQSHLARKYGNIYYYRNSYEIDCIANNLQVEVKAGKPHRRYPRKVLILDEDNIPLFLSVV